MRILIAEDDEALGRYLRQGLEAECYEVRVAGDGEQACVLAEASAWDAMILDLNLPRLDGISVLRRLRPSMPSMPVLILTQKSQVEDRVECLETGADDYIPKQLQTNSLDIDHLRDQLVVKIKAAAESYRRRSSGAVPRKPVRPVSESVSSVLAPAAIAIGTSTGGPKALQDILPQLPSDLPVPILVVQHMPPGFTEPFAHRLNGLCSIRVCQAVHDDELQAGVVYLAPSGFHMTVHRTDETHARILLSDDPRGQLHHPSVDVLMLSLAEQFGPRAMGIVMTGMGSDGVIGMTAIHRRGGVTLGQDEASSAVYGMPRACALAGCLTQVISATQIPQQILLATRYRKRA